MPKSKPPRHARGVPQHRRDLQMMEKPMPTIDRSIAREQFAHDAVSMARFARSRTGALAAGLTLGAAGQKAFSGHKQQVGKGLVSIPMRHTSPGGAAGIKRLKGAAEEAAASTWKRKIGETGGRVAKEGRRSARELAYDAKHYGNQFKAGVRRGSEVSLELGSHASRARRAGFKVGQGRKGIAAGVGALALGEAHGRMSKSLPEATAVRRVTPRTQSGRYVSHENDLVYIQPRSFGSRRPTRDSKLQVWHKKGKSAVGKASAAEAPLPTLADTSPYTGARRGRRENVLKSVAGAAESGFKRTAGDLYDRMARKEITHSQYATGHDNARNAFHIQTGQATPAPHIKTLPKMPKRHVTLPTGPRSGRKLAAPPAF